eukprot:gene10734-14418_t
MSIQSLASHPNLFVKQTKKGCLQELLCGCDANEEFKISTKERKDHVIYYARESSTCINRICCGTNRPFEINFYEGADKSSPQIGLFNRPLRCPMASCKCCCFQEVEAKSINGEVVGSVKEQFFCCVPKFDVMKPDGTVQYVLRQPTCCCGTCVDCCKLGCCSCKIPFYFYEPGNESKEVGGVTKVWRGLGSEIFTDADSFELDFPPGSDVESKFRLLAAVFLINQLFFEGQDKNNNS